MYDFKNAKKGTKTLQTCAIILNLNSCTYESKSLQIKGWFKDWILACSLFMVIHNVKVNTNTTNSLGFGLRHIV